MDKSTLSEIRAAAGRRGGMAPHINGRGLQKLDPAARRIISRLGVLARKGKRRGVTRPV